MPPKETRLIIWIVVSIALASIVVMFLTFTTLKSSDLAASAEYAKNFGFLILISLFVERATSVLVSVQGSAEHLKAKNEFKMAQARLEEARAMRAQLVASNSKVSDENEIKLVIDQGIVMLGA